MRIVEPLVTSWGSCTLLFAGNKMTSYACCCNAVCFVSVFPMHHVRYVDTYCKTNYFSHMMSRTLHPALASVINHLIVICHPDKNVHIYESPRRRSNMLSYITMCNPWGYDRLALLSLTTYVPAWLAWSPLFCYHPPAFFPQFIICWPLGLPSWVLVPFLWMFNQSADFPLLDHSSSAIPALSPSLHPCYQPPYLWKTLVLAQLPARLPINYLW